MAVANLKTIRPFIWIPPNYPVWKITIEDMNGTVYDVTDRLILAKISNGVTETIGSFSVEFWNNDEYYTGLFNGNEIFRFYADYGSTATTLRFKGKVEQPSYHDNKVTCKGRNTALTFMDKKVTLSTTAEVSSILNLIIDTYGTGFTHTNVETTTVNTTINWYQKNFWECVNELCNIVDYDCYVDATDDFHFFAVGSIDNSTDAIVHEMNLKEVRDFYPDITLVKNKIRVIGAEVDGTRILYTARDTASITEYEEREEIYPDDNITSYAQAKDVGDALLARKKDPPLIGEVESLLLNPTIEPGERVRISSPSDGLPPGYYNIMSFQHDINNNSGIYRSILKVNKEARSSSHVFKDLMEQNYKKQGTNTNPYDMEFSYDFYFDESTGTLSDAEIINGVLKPTSSSGSWQSDARAITSISQCYLVAKGTNLDNASFKVSTNNGLSFTTLTLSTLTSLNTGTNLILKVDFSSATCEIDTLSLQYK